MLTLTKKTEYALIAVTHLARNPGPVISARDIAERYGVRAPLLMNVLKLLMHNRILTSVRGTGGGYRLSRDPRSISVWQIVEAVEGPARLVRCVEPEIMEAPHQCELIGTCPIRAPLLRVHERFHRFLSELTVADVAFDDRVELNEGDGALKVLA